MKLTLNNIILFIFILAAYTIYLLSNRDYSGVGSDFNFYFNRLLYIREFNIPFSDWFSNSIESYEESNLERVSNFVPTPFYCLIFLGPLLIHGSDFLFAIQGISIAYLTFRIIRIYLKEIYFCINKKILNLIMIIGSLNPAFLKDSLTSGPVSVCNLFLLYGLFYRRNIFLSSLLFAFASMTRSTYIIYWIIMLISCLIVDRSLIKGFLKITSFSLLTYIIFYIFFYSTHTGSSFLYIWSSGLHNNSFYEDYFVKELSKYFEVFTVADIINLDISLLDFLRLIFSDFKIAYGTFVSWIFKILSSLGFLHGHLLNDMRSIYIQRLSTLTYFLLIIGPAFSVSSFSLFTFYKDRNFWLKKEKLILTFAFLFLILHSFLMGLPRYMILNYWIFIAFFLRFTTWIKSKRNQQLIE